MISRAKIRNKKGKLYHLKIEQHHYYTVQSILFKRNKKGNKDDESKKSRYESTKNNTI